MQKPSRWSFRLRRSGPPGAAARRRYAQSPGMLSTFRFVIARSMPSLPSRCWNIFQTLRTLLAKCCVSYGARVHHHWPAESRFSLDADRGSLARSRSARVWRRTRPWRVALVQAKRGLGVAKTIFIGRGVSLSPADSAGDGRWRCRRRLLRSANRLAAILSRPWCGACHEQRSAAIRVGRTVSPSRVPGFYGDGVACDRQDCQRIASRSSLKTKSSPPLSKCSVISLTAGRDASAGTRMTTSR